VKAKPKRKPAAKRKPQARPTADRTPTPSDDWIAASEVVWVYADGTRRPARIAVSRPEQRAGGEWICWVKGCPVLDRLMPVLGEDSWQALQLAMHFVGQDVHYHVERGGTLIYPPEPGKRRQRDETIDPDILLGSLFRPLPKVK
jgi:hypothetical protein